MSEWEIVEERKDTAIIKVIGVGGAGGNAVQHMVEGGIEGADFICVNTDKQALDKLGATTKLILGKNITDGLGAGADPKVGREAALEDRDRVRELLKDSDMVFVTAGMGGGTGTGAAPIVAQVAKEIGALTVAVVTKPFEIEGSKRMDIAKEGINELVEEVDSLITIPNQKLLEVLGQDCSVLEGFKQANDVEGYEVGGKTGTALKYNSKAKLNTFVALFPSSKPKHVLLVMLDEPKPAPNFIYEFPPSEKFPKGYKYSGEKRNTSGWNTVVVAGRIIEKIGPILAINNLQASSNF